MIEAKPIWHGLNGIALHATLTHEWGSTRVSSLKIGPLSHTKVVAVVSESDFVVRDQVAHFSSAFLGNRQLGFRAKAYDPFEGTVQGIEALRYCAPAAQQILNNIPTIRDQFGKSNASASRIKNALEDVQGLARHLQAMSPTLRY